MPGDLSLLDLGDPALGDAHPVGDLLLGQPASATQFGEAVTDDFGKQPLLTVL